jgi:hypothetical protein
MTTSNFELGTSNFLLEVLPEQHQHDRRAGEEKTEVRVLFECRTRFGDFQNGQAAAERDQPDRFLPRALRRAHGGGDERQNDDERAGDHSFRKQLTRCGRTRG